MAEFVIGDFTEQEPTSDEWKKFILDKPYVIFDQTLEKDLLEVSIHSNCKISENIDKINGYLEWLGGGCKDKLMEYFLKFYNDLLDENVDKDGLVEKKWYENLEIYRVLITIGGPGKIAADICCGDSFEKNHLLDIRTSKDEIIEMGYDG